MKKLILIFTLLSANAFAADPLLKKHTRSGLMIPENSFTRDCLIQTNGLVTITRREGINPPKTKKYYLSRIRMVGLKALVRIASRGKIVEAGVRCDAGDRLLYGFTHDQRFILDEERDCVSHKFNKSRAKPQLSSLAGRYCGF